MDKSKIIQAFQSRYETTPTHLVRAPGRVNLIGEHTDYNDGFVLPMAIDRFIWIGFQLNQKNLVSLYSLNYQSSTQVTLDNPQHKENWEEYVAGVIWSLLASNYSVKGWKGVLGSNIPVGAGLSSSAALELSLLKTHSLVADWPWENLAMAKLAQKTENKWVGVQSGIMDQLAIASAKEGSALFIDCRSLETSPIPFPEKARVIVMDTMTRRGLKDSEYNRRVTQCQQAAEGLGVPSLRDISLKRFQRKVDVLSETTKRRARHVISENQRTLQAAKAMRNADAVTLGKLMNESHKSLRDDYEVSSPELNIMVELAQQEEGCYGARMTGAGLGGCAVALIHKEVSDTFTSQVKKSYSKKTGLQPNLYECSAASGVSALPVP